VLLECEQRHAGGRPERGQQDGDEGDQPVDDLLGEVRLAAAVELVEGDVDAPEHPQHPPDERHGADEGGAGPV
jgi:hypothetical protein